MLRSSGLLLALIALLAASFPATAQQPTMAPLPTATPYATPSAPQIIPDVLTIASAGDVETRRAALRAHIWPGGYPEGRAFDTYLGVDDPALLAQLDATNILHVHRYRVQQAYGINADMWLYQARNPVGISLLYHAGHDYTPMNATLQQLIPRMMAAGVDLVVVGMILTPYNPDPTYQGYWVQYHTDPAALPRVDGKHPLHFFLEPAIAGLNALRVLYPGRPINMAGLSGGGWTTTMLAALDPRVVRSFNVAGSQPFDAWVDGSVSREWGVVWRDWEQGSPHQGHTDTYRIAAYRDLYVMGGHGAGRAQTQILNESDPCCWWAGREYLYAPQVTRRVAQIGEGSWRIWIDRGQSVHTVSLHATNEILRDLGLPPVAVCSC